MSMKKILSMLMAVAMVLSMVVVPVAAEGEENPYTITLSGPNGESSVTAEPGTTVDIYMTSSGDCVPGWTATGGWVTYPDGWTIKTTNKFSLAMMLDGVDSPLFNNNDDINPAMVAWACSGTTHGGTTDWSLLTLTGEMAILTFTIPEDAQPGTYDLTIANGEGADKTNFASIADENGVITDWMHADDLAVNFVGCSVVIPETVVGCPVHGEATWTEVGATWDGGTAITSGHYKLTQNVTITGAGKHLTIAADQNVCLDLNGYNITQTSSIVSSTSGVLKDYRVFKNSGTLTILDSTAAEVEGVYTSGVISGGFTTAGAGAVYARGGNYYGEAGSTLNLYSGTLSGGISRKHGIGDSSLTGGGNICSYGAVNIFGGMVKDGKAYTNYTNSGTTANRSGTVIGGNIAIIGGTLNMTGGTVTGGTVTNTVVWYKTTGSFSSLGGNINLTEGANANISGGMISNGSVSCTPRGANSTSTVVTANAFGGNIYVCSASTLTVSGNAVISGGTAHANASPAPTSSTDATLTTLTTAQAYARGGNIYAVNTNSTINVNGGELLGGAVTAGASANNGESGEATSSAVGGSIYMNEKTVFNMTDGQIGSETEGGQAASAGNLYLGEGATATISGGSIIGGKVTDNAGNVYVSGAAVTMSGGLITLGRAESDGASLGGNIRVTEATFTMTGGAITEGYSDYRGGNLQLNDGVLLMSGDAVVSGGSIPTTSTGYYGGNIYATSASTVKMEDNAVIKDGVSGRGGNVFMYSKCEFYMYGGAIYGGEAVQEAAGNDVVIGHNATSIPNAYIYGGYIGSLLDGGSNNIYLYNGVLKSDPEKFANLTGDVIASCAHVTELANGYYNIYHATGACETCGHTYSAYGVSNDYETSATEHLTLGGEHTYVDGACSVCGKTVAAHTAACSHGCENVTWVPFDGATLEDGGHYYLTDNVALAETIDVVGMNVCIDLNGFVMTAPPASRALYANTNADLAVMDSSAENTGLIRGFSLPVTVNGGNVGVYNGSVFTLYDATVANGLLICEDADNQRGGNIYASKATVIIDNGKVLNGSMVENAIAKRGGNITGYNNSTIIIKGADAKIAGGYLNGSSRNIYGGNIYSGSGGFLYIYDGEISGGYAKGGANICWMNGKEESDQKGYIYMYGGTVGEVAEGCENEGVLIYGNDSYQNELHMFGGRMDNLVDNGAVNVINIYAGVLSQDPRTLSDTEGSLLATCSCVTYDEVTGLYTVGHVNGTATCGNCSAYDKGCANGYSEAHTYAYEATHALDEYDVCPNCNTVTAVVGEDQFTLLETALEYAAFGETPVTLVKDAFVNGNVDIYCELDLNGYALTASGVVDAANEDGHIVDSVGTGTATGSDMLLYETNGMLAIDEKNNGVHSYENVDIVQKVEDIEDAEGNAVVGQKSVKFYIDKAETATKLDDAIKAGSDVEIRITVKWGENQSHSFNYTDDLVQEYLADWDHKMFTCTIIGLGDLGEYSIHADVKSDGVVVEAYDYTPEA